MLAAVELTKEKSEPRAKVTSSFFGAQQKRQAVIF
jgi:hypothetical protein